MRSSSRSNSSTPSARSATPRAPRGGGGPSAPPRHAPVPDGQICVERGIKIGERVETGIAEVLRVIVRIVRLQKERRRVAALGDETVAAPGVAVPAADAPNPTEGREVAPLPPPPPRPPPARAPAPPAAGGGGEGGDPPLPPPT